jgi:hypothetical protein
MLPKRTLNVALMMVLLATTVAVGLARSGPVAGQDAGSPTASQDSAAKIESAMSAAPSSISGAATILDNEFDDAGMFVVLHEGTNGWSCFPDIPSSPGNDPACYDETWMEWNYAFAAQEEPVVTVLGLAYMLQGGSDASNTDPFATEPAPGEDWVNSPAHVMILVPGEIDLTVYSTDHDAGEPYVMWAGTPYQHIMMPVADHEHEP